MRLDWRQKLQIAKFVMPLGFNVKERLDGIPGGHVSRPQNGQEFPLMDWTLACGENRSLGIACPDSSGIDGTDNSLRFTLLRSPVYAWHDPAKLEDDAFYSYTDQGEHIFRFLILEDAAPKSLKTLALSEHRPPVCFDWTKGMSWKTLALSEHRPPVCFDWTKGMSWKPSKSTKSIKSTGT